MMYDVVVIGGGTAGCAAAYIAGKLGLKTILIEKNIHLGGTISSGLVIPVMQSGNNQINTEFYNDLITEMQILGGQTTYQNNPGWFNHELIKIALNDEDQFVRNHAINNPAITSEDDFTYIAINSTYEDVANQALTHIHDEKNFIKILENAKIPIESPFNHVIIRQVTHKGMHTTAYFKYVDR